MAVAGHTGTLAKRMRRTAAAGRCQGKTGTLTGVSNLAGYCQAADGHVLAFAFFNDGISTDAAHVLQDHMTITLASRGTPRRSRAPPPLRPAPALEGQLPRRQHRAAASSSTGTPRRSAFSSFEPALSPATT